MTAASLWRRARRLPDAAWVGIATATVAVPLYMLTLMPGVDYWDTAEFQAIGPVLGIAHPTGFPTYTLLLWLASVVLQPFGDPALRANLLSAILVAAACATLASVVAVVTRRWLAGLAAGFCLAVAPTMWSVGLRADPHALHLALVALLLAVLVGWQRRETAMAGSGDRWLLAASVAFGVSLGNHALTLLLAPGIALYLLAVAPRMFVARRRLVVECAAVLAATTVAIYLYLPIRAAMSPPLNYANPQTWDGFRYLVFAEQFRGSLTTLPPLPEMVATVLGFTLSELGPIALLVPVGVYVAAGRHRPLLLLLGAWWSVGWVFALGYLNSEIERYYLVPLAVSTLIAGVGAGGILDFAASLWTGPAGNSAVGQGDRVGRLGGVALMVAAILFVVPTAVTVPLRYPLVDESHDTSARAWLDTALPVLAPNAVVVSWWSYATTLWYAQFVEGKRPDVFVVDDRTMIDQNLGKPADVIDRFLGQRPVYLIRFDDLAELAQAYRLTPVLGAESGDGVIYRVDGRR